MLRRSGPFSQRRAAILVVVLALLALFTVIGLGFIYFADAEATVARSYRQAQTREGGGIAPPEGHEALEKFLSVLIYDAGYTGADLFNAARGHSLARSMYGWSGVPGAHVLAFNGVGLMDDGTTLPPGVPKRHFIVNHQFLNGQIWDPEWLGPPRGMPNTPPSLGTAPYVAKNASYTYPDVNNFFLASLDVRTGEVLIPSFHRPWVFGDLSPLNPHWTDVAGRYLTLRPRPQENPGFPYVPQNADGSYTGDVQNLPGGVGPQRNDSLFMDIGLPPFQWNGKWIKPIIAPLIVALDGRLNINAVGNIANGGNHISAAGFGPWEINLSRLLPEANNLVRNRQGGQLNPVSHAGIMARLFSPTTAELPQYAPVQWAKHPASSVQFPATNWTPPQLFRGVPQFANYDHNTIPSVGHPSLFNTAEWPMAASSGTNYRSFLHTDLRRLSQRYADRPDAYKLMELYRPGPPLAPSLVGSDTAFLRNDPAHPLRMRVTTLSTGLDVPLLSPMTTDYQASHFELNQSSPDPADWHPYPNGATTFGAPPQPPATLPPTAPPPVPLPPGSRTSDYDTSRQMHVNVMAALGAINLNRKMADYAGSPTTALTPGALAAHGQGVQAFVDRHNFARDIFARLIVATGAAAAVNPGTGDVTILAAPGTPQFEALRYLAQLAVNIVDFIDADDVSTAFVWNPVGNTAVRAIATPSDLDPANFQIAQVRQHAVFGVEKPRLLINEAYSEFVTAPDEMMKLDPAAMPPVLPTKPVHVRLAIELVNPGVTPYSSGAGPLGDGSVKLFYTDNETAPNPHAAINSYQILVLRDNATGDAVNELRRLDNVRGDVTAVAPRIQIDFNALNNLAPIPSQVMPNNGAYGAGSPGFMVLAAAVQTATNDENKPILDPLNSDPAANVPAAELIRCRPPTAMMGMPETTALTYIDDAAAPNDMDLTAGSGFQEKMGRHVIVLRRLANPYVPENDPDSPPFNPALPPNPYITVDFLNYVPSMDAVAVSSNTMAMMFRQPKNGMNPNGYIPNTNPIDPQNHRYSVGRVQPMAGYYGSNAPPAIGDTDLNAHLLPQRPTAAPVENVNHTFGRHNGVDATTAPVAGDTLTTPFDWFPHFDRPLVNPLELLLVARCKPHEVTQMFLPRGQANLPPGTAGRHLARWIEPLNLTLPISPANPTSGLYRAFELLRVKPWDLNTPVGGKVYGRLNLNEAPDELIFQALLDPQPTNSFTAAHVSGIAGQMLASRTPNFNPAGAVLPNNTTTGRYSPGATLLDGGADHPFTGYGMAQWQTSTGGITGIVDSLLRPRMGSAPPTPLTWTPGQDNNGMVHPYLQTEAARKMWHNATTVSNAFAVWITVAFFEVATDASGNIQYEPGTTGIPPGRPILGREAYLEIPGDLRQQYFALIDRTNLTLDPTDPSRQGPRPFFTELIDNYYPGVSGNTIQVPAAGVDASGNPVLYTDGVAIPIIPGSVLFFGSGPDPGHNPLGWPTNRERAVVNSATYDGSSQRANITLAAPLSKFHPSGTLVTNCVPGNPGPQAHFEHHNPIYTPVVPLVVRLR